MTLDEELVELEGLIATTRRGVVRSLSVATSILGTCRELAVHAIADPDRTRAVRNLIIVAIEAANGAFHSILLAEALAAPEEPRP